MEKPRTTERVDGVKYYDTKEMDPYIAELKASLAEIVKLNEWIQLHGFVIMHGESKVSIDRARALIGEE